MLPVQVGRRAAGRVRRLEVVRPVNAAALELLEQAAERVRAGELRSVAILGEALGGYRSTAYALGEDRDPAHLYTACADLQARLLAGE